MIPKRQAITGMCAKGSEQTKPVHCIRCGQMVRVARRIGGSHDFQPVCGKCKKK